MVCLFTGPAPLAQLVREELLARGVAADIQGKTPLGQIYGSAGGPAGLQSVVVTEEVAESHRAVIDEVLSLVSEANVVSAADEETSPEPEGTTLEDEKNVSLGTSNDPKGPHFFRTAGPVRTWAFWIALTSKVVLYILANGPQGVYGYIAQLPYPYMVCLGIGNGVFVGIIVTESVRWLFRSTDSWSNRRHLTIVVIVGVAFSIYQITQ